MKGISNVYPKKKSKSGGAEEHPSEDNRVCVSRLGWPSEYSWISEMNLNNTKKVKQPYLMVYHGTGLRK